MGQYNLNRIFSPRHIAVVGGSEEKGSMGNTLMRNLSDGGFSGGVLPVNPDYKTIHGHDAVASILDLAHPVDLAIINEPLHQAVDTVKRCVDKKVKSAVILSDRSKNGAEKNSALEAEIGRIARDGELRLLGFSPFGLIRPAIHLNGSLAPEMPSSGKLAFVSQSSAMCAATIDMALKEEIGFSHFINIGSMVDIDFGDMIDYLGRDPSVDSILLDIQYLTNFRKFMRAARSVSRVKPIIVLKSGKNTRGERFSFSQTALMAGEDAVYDAAFKRAGILRVDTVESLFDCARMISKQPLPKGPRLTVITNGGEPGVIVTDTLACSGHEPLTLSTETTKALGAYLPCWDQANPIHIGNDATPERFLRTLEICFQSKDTDGALIVMVPQPFTESLTVAKCLATVIKERSYPVVICCMGGNRMAPAIDYLKEMGIPTYETPERAVMAYLYLMAYAENRSALLEVPKDVVENSAIDPEKARQLLQDAPLEGFIPEGDSRALLKAYDLPVIRTEFATSEGHALSIGREMGYPLVMKVHSSDITHKTDTGGVCLDLRSDVDVSIAYRKIAMAMKISHPEAKIEGVMIQPYWPIPDFEILLGARRDPDFGPVILFGMGGIYTDIIKDRNLGLPPMNRLLARRLMQKTHVHTLLKGYRNKPPADIPQLEEMIVRLSQLLMDFPEIETLDMNPVLIKNGHPIVVDIRIHLSPVQVPKGLHLVIAPYPAADESHIQSPDGHSILLRPVKPLDTPLFEGMIKEIAPSKIYHRFFQISAALAPQMLARFTQIDYDQEICMVAVSENSNGDEMLGAARMEQAADKKTGEFIILVKDAWLGKGIGLKLLQKCLTIAKKRGFERFEGFVLRENRNMLSMGKQLGFEIIKEPDSKEYRMVIHLGSA